jgi:4-hydroxythreonine-4-phosphate dehydrogenase
VSPPLNYSKIPKLPIGISCGEVSGIGPEIILKSWLMRKEMKLPPFIVFCNLEILKKTASDLSYDIKFKTCRPDEANDLFSDFLPVFDISSISDFTYGTPSEITAPLVIKSIEETVKAIFDHKVRALVTAPIQKSILYSVDFNYPGHTEYLAQLCTAQTGIKAASIMMLASDELRVIPMTIHVAISEVPTLITEELVIKTAQVTHDSLINDFGIPCPTIAFAGLNPHAGEEGSMGREEINIIIPALKKLQETGINVIGPMSADTMFHKTARDKYDVAICMYHDQALIPIKTIDFDSGVNITIGLPIARCSPDHGTALDIAGKGIANPTSFIKSIFTADKIAQNRAGQN